MVPFADEAMVVARTLYDRPKHVVSRTLERADWQHTSIIGGDVGEAVRALKDRHGGVLQVHGSWQLTQQLHQLGLVDVRVPARSRPTPPRAA